MELSGKRVLVVGMGITGKSCARFCKDQEAEVTVTDHNPGALTDVEIHALESSGIQARLGATLAVQPKDFDVVVLSPGVPHSLPPFIEASHTGTLVLGEIELAYRYLKVPIVAVTGTNGKTTVTSLIGRMLSASGKRAFVGGNIGTPLVDLASDEENTDIAVVEVSSFQLDTIIDFRPRVAVLLNIAEDHLDRYPDYEAYCRSKARIFRNQKSSDVAVYNGDDPLIKAMADGAESGIKLGFRHDSGVPRTEKTGAWISATSLSISLPDRASFQLDLSKTNLLGAHNRENIAAASLAALMAGGTMTGIQQVINTFEGLDHRITPVACIRGVQFINDSKATNVDAVKRALEAFSVPIVLIMGGRDKKGNFETLIPIIKKKVKQVVVMGEAGAVISKALQRVVRIQTARDMDAAVRLASESARSGEVVLLSPACASFDMYDSYKARGKDFRRAVEELK
jgi:UDP-N-acetylmuramoylalanine--D-glutamate ligase